MNLSQKLERGTPLRVLFLNDLGFQFGAGIATVRQVQSFVLRGDRVMGLCSSPPGPEEHFELNRPGVMGEWLGTHAVPELGRKRFYSNEQAAQRLALEAAGAHPDVIIVGNVHNARWPVTFLEPLRSTGAEVLAYMHDCHFATGRCAYAGPCKMYQTGCNETCPTAPQYPALAPELIHNAWLERRRIFGKGGIPLVTNSDWTRRFALDAIPDARVDVIHYGVDTDLFSPGDKADARRRLGIPDDRVVILGGAVNLQDARKGGIHLQTLFQRLGQRALGVVCGANSDQIAGGQGLGLIFSQRKLRLLYRAADIFVNTSLDEAFGQMMLEAAACGLPIVAFNIGGVTDICREGVNALLVPAADTERLIKATEFFVHDADARQRFGSEGRKIAVENFSLRRQADNWTRYLTTLART
ncbi:MAG TPA: glycosyltransferase [Verrucomicrobiae bacterium]|nr:glycosyltransferase [Verrucomicrobiae bacterium]